MESNKNNLTTKVLFYGQCDDSQGTVDESMMKEWEYNTIQSMYNENILKGKLITNYIVYASTKMWYCRTCKIHYMNFSRIWSPRHFQYMQILRSGDHANMFCLKIAWVFAKLWWYKIWSVESSFIHSRQKIIQLLYMYTLRCGHQRCDKLSVLTY